MRGDFREQISVVRLVHVRGCINFSMPGDIYTEIMDFLISAAWIQKDIKVKEHPLRSTVHTIPIQFSNHVPIKALPGPARPGSY